MNRKYMTRLAAVALLCLAAPVFAAPAGYFHEVTGEVTLTPQGGTPVKVAIGDLFESGAKVSTAAAAKATLKFADGEVVALSPNTEFNVTNYTFDKDKPAEGSILLNIARGGMRFVTGLIGKTRPANFKVQTPTVTAGVRGSAGELILSGDGPGGLIQVLAGSSEDQIIVTGANGVQVVLSPGNFSFISGNGAPSQPFTAGNAPPAAQALLAAVLQLLQAQLPSNTPADPATQGQQRKDEAGEGAQSAPQSPVEPLVNNALTPTIISPTR